MKVIYLQNSLSINGRSSLIGRKLFDKYKEASSEILLGYTIVSNKYFKSFKDKSINRDLISERILSEFSPDIVYIEKSIFVNDDT